MSGSELWQNIVKVALVGSDRQALSPPPAGDSLAALIGRIEAGDSPERYLLCVAGTVATYRQAGFRPAPLQEGTAPEPCDLSEDLPACGPLARRLLGILLAGEHRSCFAEWLERAAAAGQRVPAEYLPALLEKGRQDTELRSRLLLLLGKRGRWLAAQNPAWSYAVAATGGELDLETWQTGSPEARLALLQALRCQDPARARELVASSWKSEKADARAAQLKTFAVNLTMADEPWLEAALDDRSKQVREASAALLAELPESGLCQRAIARVEPLLAFEAGRDPAVKVSLPTACDSQMERDGIVPKPPRGKGEKAWWLEQMLQIVPPQHWCEHWQTEPQTLLQGAKRGAFLQGTALAALRHQDALWAEALLQSEGSQFILELVPQLVGVLPPEYREAHCLELLKSTREPARVLAEASQQLRQCPRPWSQHLVEALLECLANALAQVERSRQSHSQLVGFANELPDLVGYFPVSQGEQTQKTASKLEGFLQGQKLYYVDRSIEVAIACLQFRQQIYQAFLLTSPNP